MKPERTRLRGGPERTATWVWIESGSLMVEFYDYSDVAERFMGNDVAIVLQVDLERAMAASGQSEATLCPWLDAEFDHYFPLKAWLDGAGVPYHKEFETWA